MCRVIKNVNPYMGIDLEIRVHTMGYVAMGADAPVDSFYHRNVAM
jgi:hypothetical protein